ncbi:MAG: substrate-binding domain-containing protein [Clostridiaceae bacterium]|nr:substrate-binding domain-containing protein [Clostridiaceae bacterium]
MKKILSALLSAAMILALFTGCGGNTQADPPADTGASVADDTASTRGDKHIKVVLKTLASEYWAYVAKGCEQAGKDLGVTVDVLGASSETAYDEQLNIIDTTLSAGECDAIVIAPLQADSVASQIANVDLPIITIDTNVESDKVLSFVGFDNEQMASMGGAAAVDAAKMAGWTEIKAIGIAGVQGDSTSEARMAGYRKGIEESGGVYLTDETQYADGVSDKAVISMEAIVQTHPEGIAIVVANNDDMAIGAARVAASYPAYKDTIFLGCGGNVAALDAILQGNETMTVAVDGYDVGYLGVKAAVDALNGEKLEKFIASEATIVTADNAEEHKAFVEKKQNG